MMSDGLGSGRFVHTPKTPKAAQVAFEDFEKGMEAQRARAQTRHANVLEGTTCEWKSLNLGRFDMLFAYYRARQEAGRVTERYSSSRTSVEWA